MSMFGDVRICGVCGHGRDWTAVRCPHCACEAAKRRGDCMAKDGELEWNPEWGPKWGSE